MKFLLSLLLVCTCMIVQSKTLHSERSLYRNIIVEESDNRRCMVFGNRSKHPDYQSCINTINSELLVFSYTKLVMAGLSILPKPRTILIIGLGGGTIPLTLEKLYPNSQIHTIEIDAAVVRVATKWFEYKENEKQKVYVTDGRVFVKRQIRANKHYDLIILDAFNGDYIPEHLMTKEFLMEIKLLLNPNGLLIANTFSKNKLYSHESATYSSVFGKFNYIHSKVSGNRVIYAHNKILDKPIFIPKSSILATKLIQMGVDLDGFRKHLTNKPDWDENARILTDQYSPANLLN